ncbi:WD40-repeat-containing domain protein, partial [Mycena sp. CBHHK59/15]
TGHTVAGPFEGHSSWVRSVAFSPDGTRIVSGSVDHTMRMWDAQTGHMVSGPFEGHTDSVCSVAFSPDGTSIVSGSDDHTVRVWDAQIGYTVAGPFEGHSISESATILPGLPDLPSSKLIDYPTYKDGWMLNPPSDLIYWIPPWLREGLYAPRNTLVIRCRGTTKLDFSDFVHGTEWQRCIDPKFCDVKY